LIKRAAGTHQRTIDKNAVLERQSGDQSPHSKSLSLVSGLSVLPLTETPAAGHGFLKIRWFLAGVTG
jgi:hypothetical protein